MRGLVGGLEGGRTCLHSISNARLKGKVVWMSLFEGLGGGGVVELFSSS